MKSDALLVDDAGRPHLYLDAGETGVTHEVVLERMRPVVEGFCVTCHAGHADPRRAVRRARSCSAAVAYLSLVNRDRRLRTELAQRAEQLGAFS